MEGISTYMIFKSQIIYADPDKLKDNPFQKDYFSIQYQDEAKQKEFEQSVKKYGIKTPVKITTDYTIIGGHNRKYTAKKFKQKVPCQMANKIFSMDELELHTLEDNYFDKDMTRIQRDKAFNRLYQLIRQQYENYKASYEGQYIDGLSKVVQSIEDFPEKVGLSLSDKESKKLAEIKARKNNFGKDIESDPEVVQETLITDLDIEPAIADKIVKHQKRLNTIQKREQGKNDPEYYFKRIEEYIFFHSETFCSNFWTYYMNMDKTSRKSIKQKMIKLLNELDK